jgi:hypothetical protein
MVKIKYKEMPHMKPITIETKSKGFFGGIWMWIATSRKWEITQDFLFTIDSTNYMIPKVFRYGSSIENESFRDHIVCAINCE